MTFDPEQMKDPWGGTIKWYRVDDYLTGETLGQTNQAARVAEIAEAHGRRCIIVNQWSGRAADLLWPSS
jgi:hypothetical protein